MHPDLLTNLLEYPRLRELLGIDRAKLDGDALDELREMLAKREHAAAERMRERCADTCEQASNSVGEGLRELSPDESTREDVYYTCAEMIRLLEPEEPRG